MREYVCISIFQSEDGVDDKLPLDSNLHLWFARWAAICYSRYAVGNDGRTAYERLRGRTCKAVVVPMGRKCGAKGSGLGPREK